MTPRLPPAAVRGQGGSVGAAGLCAGRSALLRPDLRRVDRLRHALRVLPGEGRAAPRARRAGRPRRAQAGPTRFPAASAAGAAAERVGAWGWQCARKNAALVPEQCATLHEAVKLCNRSQVSPPLTPPPPPPHTCRSLSVVAVLPAGSVLRLGLGAGGCAEAVQGQAECHRRCGQMKHMGCHNQAGAHKPP